MTAHRKREEKATLKDFGRRIAKAMLRIRSSHVYFIIQQAYGRPPYGAQDMDWAEAEAILKKVLEEK